MIEWIIFSVIVLVISEILFLKFGNEDEWVTKKVAFLFVGTFVSGTFFLLPYGFAFNCELFTEEACTNYGIQVFYYLYGIIIGIVLFFWLNKWLLKKVRGGKNE